MPPKITGYTVVHYFIYAYKSDGLAWDWINTKAYWSDTEHREIEVLDPYTGHRRRLVHTGPNTVPRGVAVDPVITRL